MPDDEYEHEIDGLEKVMDFEEPTEEQCKDEYQTALVKAEDSSTV